MHAFTYHSPTEIVFGKDTQLQLAEQIRKYGGNRVLLVYGSGSIERSGLLNQLCQVLTEAQIPYELFGGAKANPTLEHAREGVKLALKSNACTSTRSCTLPSPAPPTPQRPLPSAPQTPRPTSGNSGPEKKRPTTRFRLVLFSPSPRQEVNPVIPRF